ncbi:hypothetical protein FL583_22025 [Cryptosporangium phraense]|uniref:Uncharacterized protein n=1 Tax=Cryptosporangium phraense TaxID=2593070 RepID=A0A545APT5_9ACTN|nr:hypothetical protein FL583_22025 [Cryptosporangium phraense]
MREPLVTHRARVLATDHGYTRQKSLDLARQQLRDEQRRRALTTYIKTLIHAENPDPLRADITITTLDIDAVAVALIARADIEGWADLIGAATLPPPDIAGRRDDAAQAREVVSPGRGPRPPADVLRRVPQDPAGYERWRRLWAELSTDLAVTNAEFAERHGMSIRQVQWIRAVGRSGFLESPIPLIDRIAELGARPPANGLSASPPADPEPTDRSVAR